MGADFRLLADNAYLDLQGWGRDLFLAAHPGVVPYGSTDGHKDWYCIVDPENLGLFFRGSPEFKRTSMWKGVVNFVRDHGRCMVISEEMDEWDECESKTPYSIYARTGHFKKKGYGPT